MLTAKAMKEMCDRLDAVEQTYLQNYYQMDTSAPHVYKRYAGASAKGVKEVEKYWCAKLPPSYRLFLRGNSGWRRLGLGWSILGVRRPEIEDMYKDVESTLGLLPTVATDEDVEDLRRKEKRSPKAILPTEHIVLGTDFNGNLLLFDHNRISDNGEPQVVSTRYLINVDRRWKSFEEFLKYVITTLEKGLARMGIDAHELTIPANSAANKTTKTTTKKKKKKTRTAPAKKKSAARSASKRVATSRKPRKTSKKRGASRKASRAGPRG